jgi:hypothetical protein
VRHLFSSRVEVYDPVITVVDGTGEISWEKSSTVIDTAHGEPGEMKCRIDLNFVRYGKDQLPAPVAGRAPDRIGVLLCSTTDGLKAGQRIKTIAGPVTGVFELRAIPDVAPDFSSAHHMEAQVIEVAQNVASFPSVAPVPGP